MTSLRRISVAIAIRLRSPTQPGVHTILTAEDTTGASNTGPARHDESLFAEDTIQHHGQLLVADIADSYKETRVAAEKIIIEASPLAPLLETPAAIAADSFHTGPHIPEAIFSR